MSARSSDLASCPIFDFLISIFPLQTSALPNHVTLGGATPAQAIAKYPGRAPTPSEIVGGLKPSSAGSGAGPTAQPVGGSTGGTTYYSPSSEGSEAGGMLLNYLLGN